MLRKSIHFTDANWALLHSYMRNRGLPSPSVAIAVLIEELVKVPANGRNTNSPY